MENTEKPCQYWVYGLSELSKTMWHQLGCPKPGHNGFIGFTAESSYLHYPEWLPPSHTITTFSKNSLLQEGDSILLPIGYKKCNTLRERIFNESLELGLKPITYCSNKAHIEIDTPSRGSWIQNNVAIQSDCKLGDGVVLWGGTGCHIGHSTEVGSFSWIATGTVISGNCRIGNNTFIGINCSIKDNIEIADHNVLGVGAIITKSTKPYEVYLAGVNNLYSKRADEID